MLPEYAATSESLPTGSAVVTHWALLEVMVTEPHVPIVAPPLSKLTVPVAPEVTVAVSVTDVPKVDDAGFSPSETTDALPDTTGISGDDRRLYCE